jgi:hypothetical protein
MGKNFALKSITKRIGGAPVEIQGYLDVDTFSSIVQTIAQSCFVDGNYRAENREIARRFVILKYLTDIEVGEENVNEIFKYTQGGAWYSQIEAEVVKLPIWAEVEQAVDRQIEYLITTQPTSFDKLCADLSAIIKTDNTQNLADIKEVLEKLNKVDKKAFVEAATENAVKKAKKK